MSRRLSSFLSASAFVVAVVAFGPLPAGAGEVGNEPIACEEAFAATGRADRLIDSCSAIIDAPGATPQARLAALLARAAAYDGKEQTERALADLNRAATENPDNARVLRRRGEVQRHGGDLDAAIRDSNEAIRLDPTSAEAFDGRGNAFNNQRRYDRAIEDYDEAIRLDPNYAQAFSDRGAAYYFKGEYERAIRDYDEAIRLNPARARAYANRGSAWKKLGRNDRALADESEAIRLDPRQAEFFDNRGLSYASNGEYDRAIADYNEAIRLRPRAKFLANRGDSWNFKGDYDRAIADYDAALKLEPGFAQALNNRGTAYRKKGDRPRALADFEAAVRANPQLDSAADNRRALAREIERLGALMPVAAVSTPASSTRVLPSFPCAGARRAVEKAICSDPDLSRLDHDIAETYARVIKSAQADAARAAKALREEQRNFVVTRNASFGRPDYDVRKALEARLAALAAIVRAAN